MDRFADAIEYDLAVRGIDLVEEWRMRRFRRILNLVDHLPRNSAYVQAVTDDEEWAEQVLNLSQNRKPTVHIADWSPELERLTDLYDRVGELIRAVVAGGGQRPKRIPPAPRPTTALDRVRARKRRAQHDRLVSVLLPDKAR